MILFLRYPFSAVLLWILLFPFFAHNVSTADRFMFWVLHRAMVPLAFAITLFSGWFDIRRRAPVRFGRAEVAMALFLGLVAVNVTVLTPDPTQNFIRLYDRILVPFCMYWLIRLAAPSSRDLTRLCWVGLITVLLQSTIGLIGWFRPSDLPVQWLGREGERVVGTFGNPAVFTSTLILMAVLMLQYARQHATDTQRPLFMLGVGLVFVSVFFSFSRGSWLGGVLVWIGLLFVYPRMIVRFTSLALIGGSLIAIVWLPSQLEYAARRLETSATAEGRILQTVTQLKMIRERPLLGWGFFNYDTYDERFKERVGNIAVRYQAQTSHNTFLLIIAELGVPALLLYLFPAFWWLRLTRKIWRRLPERGLRSYHLLALLWLLMLDHFTVNNFMEMIQSYPLGTTVWWLALGLIASLVYPHLKPSDFGVPQWVLAFEGSRSSDRSRPATGGDL
jgi:O-antigen ligase